jgi:CheY-like chemotaxis protein
MKQGHILQVEDNPDDIRLLELAFKRSRIKNELIVVTDGKEALDYLFYRGKYIGRNPEDKPSLILLDLKLPLVDGLEVLKEIRSNEDTKSIPVIVMTSSDEPGDHDESRKLGANAYICKPPGLKQLINILGQIESEWLTDYPTVS